MSAPLRPPADWSKYETNEVSPGCYALTPAQSEEFLREIADDAPCPRCEGRVYGRICHPCDMLMPVGWDME